MRNAIGWLVFLAGCAATVEPSYWTGDERFSQQERAQILEGAAFISAATGTDPLDIRWGHVTQTPKNIVRYRMPQGLGGSGDIGSWVGLDTAQCGYLLATAAAHELGHVLGLEYLPPGQEGLMSPDLGPLRWTDADEAACEKVGVCKRNGGLDDKR